MRIRMFVSIALLIAFSSTFCKASKPEPICFVKYCRCCYEYGLCDKVVKNVQEKYSCMYNKCHDKCEDKVVLEDYCHNVPDGTNGTKLLCEEKNVTKSICHPDCSVSEGICVRYAFRAFPKYCPMFHCYDDTLISGVETKPRDVIGTNGTFIKSEVEVVRSNPKNTNAVNGTISIAEVAGAGPLVSPEPNAIGIAEVTPTPNFPEFI